MFLDSETFRVVVANAPLVAIDLLLRKPGGEMLLGLRLNRPALGCWFVPGGRILKNESLDAAFERITRSELGRAFTRDQARLLGVFEHFYPDSVFGNDPAQPDTHYIVLAYRLDLADAEDLRPPTLQHGHYRWWRPAAIRQSDQVHDNTRAYLAAELYEAAGRPGQEPGTPDRVPPADPAP